MLNKEYRRFETKLPDEVTLPRSLGMIIFSISYIWSDTVMYNVYVETTLSNLAAPVQCVQYVCVKCVCVKCVCVCVCV